MPVISFSLLLLSQRLTIDDLWDPLAATCTMSFPVRPGSAQPASRDSLGKDQKEPPCLPPPCSGNSPCWTLHHSLGIGRLKRMQALQRDFFWLERHDTSYRENPASNHAIVHKSPARSQHGIRAASCSPSSPGLLATAKLLILPPSARQSQIGAAGSDYHLIQHYGGWVPESVVALPGKLLTGLAQPLSGIWVAD